MNIIYKDYMVERDRSLKSGMLHGPFTIPSSVHFGLEMLFLHTTLGLQLQMKMSVLILKL